MDDPKSSSQSALPSSTPPSGHRLAPSSHHANDALHTDPVRATANTTLQTSAVHGNATASLLNAQLPPPGTDDDLDASSPLYLPRFHIRNPSYTAGLSLQTDLLPPQMTAASNHAPSNPTIVEGTTADLLRYSATAPIPIHDGYLRSALSTADMSESLSPASLLSSPALNALADLTPLPSPLVMSDSPGGPWAKAGMTIRPRSRGTSTSSRDDTFVMLSKGSLSPSPSLKKKGYQMLRTTAHQAADASMQTQQKNEANHGRNRSLSEFKPDALHNTGTRHVTISNVAPEQMQIDAIHEPTLHREAYLAAQRGLISAAVNAGIPTPPASNRSVTESEGEEVSEEDRIRYITVRQGPQMTKKLWRPVRVLGQGTFSKVWLATDEKRPAKDPLDESTLDPHRLVAIKVVERGPAGGADEDRVQLSLKREVEMLRSISHPSLVHLRAFDHGEAQALLVLTYCPGGDLFDVASTHRELLNAGIVQRIFAELISATRYLHDQLIVHRDIKLESTFFRPGGQSTQRDKLLTCGRCSPQHPNIYSSAAQRSTITSVSPSNTYGSGSLTSYSCCARVSSPDHSLRQ
jgi:protein-serine/threonine kinase